MNFDQLKQFITTDMQMAHIRLQWGGDGSWDKRIAEYYAQGMEKYGEKLQQVHASNSINEQTRPSEPNLFLSFAERRKKDNFTPVKFKDFKV